MDIQNNLNDTLSQFNCTANYYEHPLGFMYTNGVQYLASKYQTYWLLTDIGLHIKSQPKLIANLDFHTWTLKRFPTTTGQISNNFTLTAEDGNYNKLFQSTIPFSDFQANQVTLWFESGVLILPSEH